MWFKGSAAVGVLVAMLAATSVSAATPLVERLQFAADRARQDNCTSSLGIVKDILREQEFAALPEKARVAAFELATSCAAMLRDATAAYSYALEGTRLNGAGAYMWHVRFGTEANGKRYASAVETLEAMARQRPDALNALKVKWLYSLKRDLRQQPDRLLLGRFLAVLTSRDYQPDEVMATGDLFKSDYAAMLAEADRTADAVSLLARIVDPHPLIRASVDPRLRALLPPGFDVRAAVEARLAQTRDVAASHPGSMLAVLTLADHLLQLGRPDEALATLEAAHPDRTHAVVFDDLDERRSWWWNSLSNTYEMLGREDEAVAALRRGGQIEESGRLNVSQALNLGYLQVNLGRPADTLATVAVFDKDKRGMSPYGEMVLRLVRGCARLALGQADAARADHAYVVSHENNHPAVSMYLSLCAGDMAAAAAAAIRRLDNPDQRIDALLDFSDYDPPPVGQPFTGIDARIPELKARPDVQAAIVRAGGTARFRLQHP